jgi:small conductance mechanosensitive channel
MVWAWALTFLPRVAAAFAIVIVGFFAAGWVVRLIRRLAARTTRIDATIEPILATVARYAVLILFLIAALGQLGVQTASLLAVLGAAGLAIGLALQGTLQNIAAGIMLIYLRPFHVGDYIETPTVSGTVREIGLFVTHLDTGDGLFFFAPNSEIWNKPLKNHTRNPRRLMTIKIGIGYRSDPAEARRVLMDMAASDGRILKEPAPNAYVDAYGENAITIALQAWAPTNLYWDAHRQMTGDAKTRLESAGIEIPFPPRIVQVVSGSADDAGPRSGGGNTKRAEPSGAN